MKKTKFIDVTEEIVHIPFKQKEVSLPVNFGSYPRFFMTACNSKLSV